MTDKIIDKSPGNGYEDEKMKDPIDIIETMMQNHQRHDSDLSLSELNEYIGNLSVNNSRSVSLDKARPLSYPIARTILSDGSIRNEKGAD